VLRRFDGLVAVNQEIQQFFRRLGCAEDKIHLISPHAFPILHDDVMLPSELRDFYSTHSPLLLTIGLLEPEYDLTLQITLLSHIRKAHPGAGLVIIGSGSLETELRFSIDALPDKQHIVLAGDVDHAITLRALAECDLFLRTTLYDGDSISVREALHLGKDVIATDNGMRPEGVTIVPVSSLPDVEEAVLARLATHPGGDPAIAPPDVSNLQSVLDMYRELVPSPGLG
jgi:glycosyltransferase involved in cell wall biosynthesis